MSGEGDVPEKMDSFDDNDFAGLSFESGFESILEPGPSSSSVGGGVNFDGLHSTSITTDSHYFGQCPRCDKYRSDLERLDKDHRVNFQFLKKKIISTDLLIRRCKAKTDESEAQSKTIEDLNTRLEQADRDSAILSEQLQSAVANMTPLKDDNERLEQMVKIKSSEINDLRIRLAAEEAFKCQRLALDSEIKSKESETVEMKRKIQYLERRRKLLLTKTDKLEREKSAIASEKSIIAKRMILFGKALQQAQDIVNAQWRKLQLNGLTAGEVKPYIMPARYKSFIAKIQAGDITPGVDDDKDEENEGTGETVADPDMDIGEISDDGDEEGDEGTGRIKHSGEQREEKEVEKKGKGKIVNKKEEKLSPKKGKGKASKSKEEEESDGNFSDVSVLSYIEDELSEKVIRDVDSKVKKDTKTLESKSLKDIGHGNEKVGDNKKSENSREKDGISDRKHTHNKSPLKSKHIFSNEKSSLNDRVSGASQSTGDVQTPSTDDKQSLSNKSLHDEGNKAGSNNQTGSDVDDDLSSPSSMSSDSGSGDESNKTKTAEKKRIFSNLTKQSNKAKLPHSEKSITNNMNSSYIHKSVTSLKKDLMSNSDDEKEMEVGQSGLKGTCDVKKSPKSSSVSYAKMSSLKRRKKNNMNDNGSGGGNALNDSLSSLSESSDEERGDDIRKNKMPLFRKNRKSVLKKGASKFAEENTTGLVAGHIALPVSDLDNDGDEDDDYDDDYEEPVSLPFTNIKEDEKIMKGISPSKDHNISLNVHGSEEKKVEKVGKAELQAMLMLSPLFQVLSPLPASPCPSIISRDGEDDDDVIDDISTNIDTHGKEIVKDGAVEGSDDADIEGNRGSETDSRAEMIGDNDDKTGNTDESSKSNKRNAESFNISNQVSDGNVEEKVEISVNDNCNDSDMDNPVNNHCHEVAHNSGDSETNLKCDSSVEDGNNRTEQKVDDLIHDKSIPELDEIVILNSDGMNELSLLSRESTDHNVIVGPSPSRESTDHNVIVGPSSSGDSSEHNVITGPSLSNDNSDRNVITGSLPSRESTDHNVIIGPSSSGDSSEHNAITGPSLSNDNSDHNVITGPSPSRESTDHNVIVGPSSSGDSSEHNVITGPSLSNDNSDHNVITGPSPSSDSTDHNVIIGPSPSSDSTDHKVITGPSSSGDSADYNVITGLSSSTDSTGLGKITAKSQQSHDHYDVKKVINVQTSENIVAKDTGDLFHNGNSNKHLHTHDTHDDDNDGRKEKFQIEGSICIVDKSLQSDSREIIESEELQDTVLVNETNDSCNLESNEVDNPMGDSVNNQNEDSTKKEGKSRNRVLEDDLLLTDESESKSTKSSEQSSGMSDSTETSVGTNNGVTLSKDKCEKLLDSIDNDNDSHGHDNKESEGTVDKTKKWKRIQSKSQKSDVDDMSSLSSSSLSDDESSNTKEENIITKAKAETYTGDKQKIEDQGLENKEEALVVSMQGSKSNTCIISGEGSEGIESANRQKMTSKSCSAVSMSVSDLSSLSSSSSSEDEMEKMSETKGESGVRNDEHSISDGKNEHENVLNDGGDDCDRQRVSNILSSHGGKKGERDNNEDPVMHNNLDDCGNLASTENDNSSSTHRQNKKDLKSTRKPFKRRKDISKEYVELSSLSSSSSEEEESVPAKKSKPEKDGKEKIVFPSSGKNDDEKDDSEKIANIQSPKPVTRSSSGTRSPLCLLNKPQEAVGSFNSRRKSSHIDWSADKDVRSCTISPRRSNRNKDSTDSSTDNKSSAGKPLSPKWNEKEVRGVSGENEISDIEQRESDLTRNTVDMESEKNVSVSRKTQMECAAQQLAKMIAKAKAGNARKKRMNSRKAVIGKEVPKTITVPKDVEVSRMTRMATRRTSEGISDGKIGDEDAERLKTNSRKSDVVCDNVGNPSEKDKNVSNFNSMKGREAKKAVVDENINLSSNNQNVVRRRTRSQSLRLSDSVNDSSKTDADVESLPNDYDSEVSINDKETEEDKGPERKNTRNETLRLSLVMKDDRKVSNEVFKKSDVDENKDIELSSKTRDLNILSDEKEATKLSNLEGRKTCSQSLRISTISDCTSNQETADKHQEVDNNSDNVGIDGGSIKFRRSSVRDSLNESQGFIVTSPASQDLEESSVVGANIQMEQKVGMDVGKTMERDLNDVGEVVRGNKSTEVKGQDVLRKSEGVLLDTPIEIHSERDEIVASDVFKANDRDKHITLDSLGKSSFCTDTNEQSITVSSGTEVSSKKLAPGSKVSVLEVKGNGNVVVANSNTIDKNISVINTSSKGGQQNLVTSENSAFIRVEPSSSHTEITKSFTSTTGSVFVSSNSSSSLTLSSSFQTLSKEASTFNDKSLEIGGRSDRQNKVKENAEKNFHSFGKFIPPLYQNFVSAKEQTEKVDADRTENEVNDLTLEVGNCSNKMFSPTKPLEVIIPSNDLSLDVSKSSSSLSVSSTSSLSSSPLTTTALATPTIPHQRKSEKPFSEVFRDMVNFFKVLPLLSPLVSPSPSPMTQSSTTKITKLLSPVSTSTPEPLLEGDVKDLSCDLSEKQPIQSQALSTKQQQQQPLQSSSDSMMMMQAKKLLAKRKASCLGKTSNNESADQIKKSRRITHKESQKSQTKGDGDSDAPAKVNSSQKTISFSGFSSLEDAIDYNLRHFLSQDPDHQPRADVQSIVDDISGRAINGNIPEVWQCLVNRIILHVRKFGPQRSSSLERLCQLDHSSTDDVSGGLMNLEPLEQAVMDLILAFLDEHEGGVIIPTLMASIWSAIFDRSLTSTGVRLCFCRLFCAFCKKFDDLGQARLLVYNIAWCGYLHFSSCVLSMVEVWPEVVPLTFTGDDGCQQLSPISKVLHLVMYLEMEDDEVLVRRIMSALKCICGWQLIGHHPFAPHTLLKYLLDPMIELSNNSNPSSMYEYTMAIELLCMVQGSAWTQDHFIQKSMIAVFQRWTMTSSLSVYSNAMVSLLKITKAVFGAYSFSDNTIRTLGGQIFGKAVVTKLESLPLTISFGQVLMELCPLHPDLYLKFLQAWEETNLGRLPSSILTQLEVTRNFIKTITGTGNNKNQKGGGNVRKLRKKKGQKKD